MTPFRLIEKKQFVVMQLLSGFDGAEAAAFDQAVDRLLSQPRHLLLNMAGVESITEVWIEKLHFLDQQLKSAGKKTRIVFASETLRNTLSDSRFAAALTLKDTLESAIEDLSSQADLSSRQFIKAFVNATLRTFYVQAKTHCQRGTIFVKQESKDRLLGDLSGIIRVLGAKFSYGVMLSFPKATFLKLITRLTGEESQEITKENEDAAAELMNIVFGQAKLVLNLRGAGLQPQLPVLAKESSFAGLALDPNSQKLTPLSAGKTVVVPFESDIGGFFVEVWLPESAEKSAKGWFS